MKKCFVTGATGFIGHRLLEKLVENEYYAVGCVRTESQTETILTDSVVINDISSFNRWNQVLEGVNVIVHLAARVHVLSGKSNSYDAIEAVQSINRDATLRLAKAAVESNVRRFIYVSSISVLGHSTTICNFNNNSKYDPKEPYGVSKMEAEIGLKKIADSSTMEIVIVRPPLVYGANAPGNFNRLLKLVDMGLPLPLGGMHSKKSMMSLENLCDLLMKTITGHLPKLTQLVVSDGSDWSTTELVTLIAKYMGHKFPLIAVPVPILIAFASLIGKKEDIRKLAVPLQVDGSETARMLDWTPIQSPEDGVKEAVEYYLGQKQ